MLAVIVLAVAFTSCKKKTTPIDEVTKANVSIAFKNYISGQPVVKDQLIYTNTAGNLFSVSLLKYYVTNVVLVKSDNTEFALNNYDLIDAFDPSNFSTVEAKDVPNGNYTTLRFYFGVDKSRNHTGAQDGDLDPINNMIWTWSTGYLFFKHEGIFVNSTNDTTQMQYHLGTDDALSTVEIPITLGVDGKAKTLNIAFDLNNMYNNPVIDFNTKAIRHSTAADDTTWIQQMVLNTADAFSFMSQE